MAQKASSSKKLAASNDRPNTEIRFILSLSCCQYRFLFADLRKVGVVSRFIPFIADNFVRLASPATVSKSNDHFILRIYHTGRRGGEQVRRSLIAAIFPAIVPSSPFPSLDRKPLNPVDRSNRERGRVIFASTCCNFTKFHHRISRFICIPPSFLSWILIGFYFVNSSFLFFFEEEEEGKREFRFVSLMNHGVKLIFSGFAYFVFFLFLLQSLTFNDYV